MDNFEQQNGIDTVGSVDKDISSLYSALKHDYEGNNIANIITQLLHIYQPKDGIIAYECVLRKVQDLLEDCNSRKKQLLLSVIPVPDNVPDHKIKEVFHTTTGFIKLNLQENNMFQNMFDVKNMDGIMDNNILSSKQSFLYNKNASNFKSSLSEAYPFRGFPENEISTIHSHVKNVNHLYKTIECEFPRSEIVADVSPNSASYINRQADSLRHQLSNNPKNWLDRNNKYQMSFYQQYLFNKKYNTPTRISTVNEPDLWYSSSQTIYQDTCSIKTYKDSEIIANLWQDKVPRQFNNIKYEYKKSEDNNAFNKDKKFGVSQMIIDIGQNATIKQTIKDNIDMCWNEDQNIVVDTDDLLATMRDKLKTSLKNFLKRAQEGTFIELSTFPRTRSHPQSSSLNLVCFTSKDQKPGMPRKVSEQNFTSSISNNNSNCCLFLNQQNTDINLRKNQRGLDKKTKQKAFSGLQSKCNTQEINKVTESQLQQNNLDYIMEKKVITLECKENNSEESMHGCKIESKSNDINTENNFRVHSMSQLAAYKKHYYDTLLSVQRAKVAVTNSLASSSDHLTGYDDPYYSNYIDQQQHLFHQQRHFMTRPQFLTYPAELSGLSNVHGNQYSWAKSVYKYLLLKQLRLQQQTSPLYARNQNGWIHRYIGPVYPYSFTSNESAQAKHFIRRKSLEDIVGKLKEIERNNVNN